MERVKAEDEGSKRFSRLLLPFYITEISAFDMKNIWHLLNVNSRILPFEIAHAAVVGYAG